MAGIVLGCTTTRAGFGDSNRTRELGRRAHTDSPGRALNSTEICSQKPKKRQETEKKKTQNMQKKPEEKRPKNKRKAPGARMCDGAEKFFFFRTKRVALVRIRCHLEKVMCRSLLLASFIALQLLSWYFFEGRVGKRGGGGKVMRGG